MEQKQTEKINYKKLVEELKQENQFLAQNIENKDKEISELEKKIEAKYRKKINDLEQEKSFLAQNIENKDKEYEDKRKEAISKLEQEKRFLAQNIENKDKEIVEIKNKYEQENEYNLAELTKKTQKQIEDLKQNAKAQFDEQMNYIKRRETEASSMLNFMDNVIKNLESTLYLMNYIETDLKEKIIK